MRFDPFLDPLIAVVVIATAGVCVALIMADITLLARILGCIGTVIVGGGSTALLVRKRFD
jgi:hypothetical protein